MGELDDLREHMDRYRAVTLQHFEILSAQDMAWRPRPDAFSCAQQLLHIIQTEDYFISGLFRDDWSLDRLTFPKPMPAKHALHQQFLDVRRRTASLLSTLNESTLSELRRHGHAAVESSIRAWLWFIVEHEIHHKAQLAEYLRTLGYTPPYFAMVFPLGDRPDITARSNLGGV
jgi:uncharacterized damage-inducible protein DinB